MILAPNADALSSPDWLLAGFDMQQDRYHFARVNRESYKASSFLDHRIQPKPTETTSLSGIEVDAVLQHQPVAQSAWIFHTGFCCSTLLASCLDHLGSTLVLREPLVLSRLAQVVRDTSSGDKPDAGALTENVIALCERSYPDERLLIKPSNFANILMTGLMSHVSSRRQQAGRKAILMSCSLDALLLSILKKKAEAEATMPGFLRALLQDSDYLQRVDVPDPASLDLLQQSVLFWHCQRYFLQQQSEAALPGRLMTLSMERFLAQPVAVITTVSEFLQLGLSSDLIEQTVQSGAFRRHSKQAGTDYSPAAHRLEQQATLALFADEIASARVWAKPLLEQLPVKPFDQFESDLLSD